MLGYVFWMRPIWKRRSWSFKKKKKKKKDGTIGQRELKKLKKKKNLFKKLKIKILSNEFEKRNMIYCMLGL